MFTNFARKLPLFLKLSTSTAFFRSAHKAVNKDLYGIYLAYLRAVGSF